MHSKDALFAFSLTLQFARSQRVRLNRYALSIGSFKQSFCRIEEFLQINSLVYEKQQKSTLYHSHIPLLALAYPVCRNRKRSWTRASFALRTLSKDQEILLSAVGGSRPRLWRVLPNMDEYKYKIPVPFDAYRLRKRHRQE